ncbi:MAG: efflux RND transporter periplasmic adaptor subunit [Gemmatimonadetes bacterium]|nr:efflux RND transporter periplasmic adaptor subunit [Gemmatimonadota bacterium]MDA1104865.1 efflux RND transporter periplasmic adaptor subunit [Gemmatimonadota bacterium]
MSHSRRTLSLVTVVLILGGLGAGVAWRLLASRPATEGTVTEDQPQLPGVAEEGPSQFSATVAQPVGGAEVVRDTLWIRVGAAGQAEAIRRTTLLAQVEGVVRSVPVRENLTVGSGTPLVQIDTTELALGLAQARADLLAAETDYRQRTLFDDEITDLALRADRERIARSMSGLDQAEVRLRQADLQLQRSRVLAPFRGRIADIRVVEGQHVSVGSDLLTVVDLDLIKVEVRVLEAELGFLSEGRRAEVTFAAFPGEVFGGAIETINPVVDPESRTGRVTVLLPNADGRIKPGMYAEVSLDAEALPDRVLVPRSAILERGEGRRRTMLFVYEESERGALAKWRYVNTGRENDTHVEIVVEGAEQGTVEPGEVVLIDGHHYLAHDTPIRLVDDVVAEGGRPGR